MPKVTTALQAFLAGQRRDHHGSDLIDRWTPYMETQVNVSAGDGQAVHGKRGTYSDGVNEWFNIRIPRNANSTPEFRDYELRWPLEEHAEAIGCTGWDWSARRSRWVGFDFDSLTGHSAAAGISDAELDRVREVASALPWVEVRRSTRGKGLHLYVYFDDAGVPTENHTEHAALGRAILGMMSSETGFDFARQVDCAGGNMWIWSRAARDGGLELIKGAQVIVTEGDLPADWRNPPPPKTTPPSGSLVNGSMMPAVAAMLRMTIEDNNDGSRRLFAYCCRAVEHNLTDADAVAAIREAEQLKPFPRPWPDDAILRRLHDAEATTTRGEALSTTSLRTPAGRTDAANAERLKNRYGELMRWVEPWRKWLTWDTQRWSIDDSCSIEVHAKEISKGLWTEVSGATSK